MYLHKDLSYKIVGIAMKIHREYGPNHNERIYHKLFEEQLDLNKIKYISKPKIPVYSRETGKKVGLYVPDDLVENLIIVELKAYSLSPQHEIQLSEYLKTTPYEIGYLFNFGQPSLYFKRIIYTNDRKSFLSDTKQNLEK